MGEHSCSSRHQTACFKATEGLHLRCRADRLSSLRYEFWAVFTRLGSAVCFATLYDFTVTLKYATWWRLLIPGRNSWHRRGAGVVRQATYVDENSARHVAQLEYEFDRTCHCPTLLEENGMLLICRKIDTRSSADAKLNSLNPTLQIASHVSHSLKEQVSTHVVMHKSVLGCSSPLLSATDISSSYKSITPQQSSFLGTLLTYHVCLSPESDTGISYYDGH
jgi:hypothetical protein